MAAALVQTKGGAGGTNVTLTWGSNTTGGNLIVVGVYSDQGNGDISSVTDSQSNTYTKIIEDNNVPGGRGSVNLTLWYASNITGGVTPTITVHGTFAGTKEAIAREYSGLLASPLDKSKSNPGTSNTADSLATTALAETPELLIGVAAIGNATPVWTVGSGYGNLITQGTSSAVSMEDQRVTVGGTYNATFGLTNTPDWVAAIATFAETGATSTSTSSSTSISTSSTSTSSTSSSISTSSTSSSISTSTSSTSTSHSTSTSSTSQSTSTSSTSTSHSTSTSSTSTSQSTSTSSTSTSQSITTSTSSTSSSISTSSTSSSTSISTSTSSTSSSISTSSTSTSKSTSTSSTSSSISTSSTSSSTSSSISTSSTSSSISTSTSSTSTSTTISTTTSTSSTSTSSTSSSSSTSTTLPPDVVKAAIKPFTDPIVVTVRLEKGIMKP